jgi:hypothetical protein
MQSPCVGAAADFPVNPRRRRDGLRMLQIPMKEILIGACRQATQNYQQNNDFQFTYFLKIETTSLPPIAVCPIITPKNS